MIKNTLFVWSVKRCTPSDKLLIAAQNGALCEVKNLIRFANADPCITDINGMTPLHFAARDGHAKMCDYLVRHIISSGNKPLLESETKDGETALFLATLMGVNSVRDTIGKIDLLKSRYNPIIQTFINANVELHHKYINNCIERNNREGIEAFLTSIRKKNFPKQASKKLI